MYTYVRRLLQAKDIRRGSQAEPSDRKRLLDSKSSRDEDRSRLQRTAGGFLAKNPDLSAMFIITCTHCVEGQFLVGGGYTCR